MSEIDLTSPEVKKAIADAVEDATAGLIAKRDELLGKVKKLQKDAAIDPADMAALEAERDDLKAKLTEQTKLASKATKDLDAANKAREQAESFGTKLLVDNGLNDALAKAGVTDPAYLKAAKALLGGQVQIVADGDSRVAKVGDKALVDHITEWAGSDEGKRFVSAPNANGGGSHGGNRGNHQKSVSRAQFDGMSADERAAHISTQGVVTD